MTRFACETMPNGARAEIAARFAALVPALETERLTLRAVTPADFPIYADIMAGPSGAFMGGPFERDDAWWDFAQLASGWMLHGHGGWAVDLKDGTHIGFVLLGFEPGDEEPELGFLFAPEAEGKGYAFEASSAVKAFAFDTLNFNTLVSYIHPSNTRSIKLAKRLGAIQDGTVTYSDDVPTPCFRYAKGGV